MNLSLTCNPWRLSSWNRTAGLRVVNNATGNLPWHWDRTSTTTDWQVLANSPQPGNAMFLPKYVCVSRVVGYLPKLPIQLCLSWRVISVNLSTCKYSHSCIMKDRSEASSYGTRTRVNPMLTRKPGVYVLFDKHHASFKPGNCTLSNHLVSRWVQSSQAAFVENFASVLDSPSLGEHFKIFIQPGSSFSR